MYLILKLINHKLAFQFNHLYLKINNEKNVYWNVISLGNFTIGIASYVNQHKFTHCTWNTKLGTKKSWIKNKFEEASVKFEYIHNMFWGLYKLTFNSPNFNPWSRHLIHLIKYTRKEKNISNF